MHYTREPIIETVVTPREGYKLLVRSSKSEDREEYYVEALEIVSFGHSLFFRSTERPNSFLVPVSDYEILEVKEMKMPLKLSGGDKANKGASSAKTQQREPVEELREEGVSEEQQEFSSDQRFEKKRDRGRRRRRRGGGATSAPLEPRSESAELLDETSSEQEEMESVPQTQGVETGGEIAPSFISKLFPPPPTLIKETLSRYKISEEEEKIVEEKLPLPEDLLEPGSSEDEVPDSDDETKLEE